MRRIQVASTYTVTAADQTNGYAVIDIIRGKKILRNLALLYPSNVVSWDGIIREEGDNPLSNGIPIFMSQTAPSNSTWLGWRGREEVPDYWVVTIIVYPVYTGDSLRLRAGIEAEDK